MNRTISSDTQAAFTMLGLLFTFIVVLGFTGFSFDCGRPRWDMLPLAGFPAFCFFVALLRKNVRMDELFLYVSGFRREARIPLDQISSVTESIGMKDRSVTIHFRTRTPFGRSVTFSPNPSFSEVPHPIVAELLAHALQPR